MVSSEIFYDEAFDFDREIKNVTWLDGGADVEFKQNDGKVVIHTRPFHYGRHLVLRVAKIEC